MIKLTDLIREIIQEDLRETAKDMTWYHGSTVNITQNELNPLYRESDKYKSKTGQSVSCIGKTGSSGGGVGIYFGSESNPNVACSSCPRVYSGYDCNFDSGVKEGFIYEMKFKPDAKIGFETDSGNNCDLKNLSKGCFQAFIQKGIDAIVTESFPSKELNLLNPNAVQYFKKVKYWKWMLSLEPHYRAKTFDIVHFNDEKEMLDYVKKEIGDYRLFVNPSSKKPIAYLPKDENIEKHFNIVTPTQKWFDV